MDAAPTIMFSLLCTFGLFWGAITLALLIGGLYAIFTEKGGE